MRVIVMRVIVTYEMLFSFLALFGLFFSFL